MNHNHNQNDQNKRDESIYTLKSQISYTEKSPLRIDINN